MLCAVQISSGGHKSESDAFILTGDEVQAVHELKSQTLTTVFF